MSSARVRYWSVAELGRFLIAPDASEQLSPIEGPGVMVLDLAASTSAQVDAWGDSLLEQLPVLPCVTIAIEGDTTQESVRPLELACDVVLRDPGELDPLLEGFAKTPIAALVLVQLLRVSASLSVSAGLIAESFAYSTLQSGGEFRDWLAARPEHRSASSRDPGPACRLDRDRTRLEVSLARPTRHNAFSREMRDAFSEAMQFALVDPSIEEIVLRGDGNSFCSGGDLDEFGSLSSPAEAHAIRTTRSPALLISRLGGRIRVDVHGACLGAGIELAAFAGRIVATEDAYFQLPEVRIGLVPGAGGTVSLPRRIGRQKTAWLGLSGCRIDAQTALEWGLVDEVQLRQH